MARARRMKIGCSPPLCALRSSATCHWAMV
jgi:hypothetical protein